MRPKFEEENKTGEINIDDISSEIEYWGTTVVCYVLGAIPQFAVFNGFIQR